MAFEFEKGGLEDIGDGVYVYVGPGGSSNNGIVLTDEGTLSIDSFITNYDGLMHSLEQVTNRSVSVAVNTHDDADHYSMNHYFRRQGATIFASDVCRERIETKMGMGVWVDNLKSRNPERAAEMEPEELIPHIGVSDAATLRIAGEKVDLIHVGHGHCPGDMIVHMPERGVLFAGDLVYAGVHGRLKTADIGGLIVILDRLLTIDCDTVVPGHGRPVKGINREMVEAYKDYVVTLRDRVAELDADGVALEDMEDKLQDWKYLNWKGSGKFAVSVQHIYKDVVWRKRFGYDTSNMINPGFHKAYDKGAASSKV